MDDALAGRAAANEACGRKLDFTPTGLNGETNDDLYFILTVLQISESDIQQGL